MIVELYEKQLLFAKLGKIGGKFWFSELWPRVLNVTVTRLRDSATMGQIHSKAIMISVEIVIGQRMSKFFFSFTLRE